MGIATEMKELTRDITSSHRARARRLGEIRRETKQVRGEAQSLIKGFEASRVETTRQLRKDLAQDKASRKSEVTGMLRGFERTRREEGTRMRRELTQGVAERRSEVNGMRADAQQTIKGFRSQREKMGTQLRRDLAKDKAQRNSSVNEMRGDFRKAQAEVKADLKGARAAWQGLAGTIQVSKGRTEKPLETEAPADEEENPDLETKMLAAVNQHPEGINLAGIADSLGVAPVVLGRVSKSLIKKREIRKEEKLYFPADGGDSKQGPHFRPPLR